MNKFYLFLTLLIYSGASQAQEKASDWPSGSAMGVGLEARDKINDTLKKIPSSFAELIKSLDAKRPNDPRLIDAIKDQNKKWLSYIGSECEVVGALTGAGGSWPSTWATLCEDKLINERLLLINNANKCIKESKDYEINLCINTLLGFHKEEPEEGM